jgi:hypothetical protein
MPVDLRPAIPMAMPRAAPSSLGRRRLLRWFATTVTTITAAVAILIVAIGAVLLGMTWRYTRVSRISVAT